MGTLPVTLGDNRVTLRYQSGFGNEYATEALRGALPVRRNSPQRHALQLYPELVCGRAFTALRHENRRSWLYRRQPSVVSGRFESCAQPLWQTRGDEREPLPPEPTRWHPLPIDTARGCDFVDGMRTIALNGDPAMPTGIAVHVYLADQSMGRRALVDAAPSISRRRRWTTEPGCSNLCWRYRVSQRQGLSGLRLRIDSAFSRQTSNRPCVEADTNAAATVFHMLKYMRNLPRPKMRKCRA